MYTVLQFSIHADVVGGEEWNGYKKVLICICVFIPALRGLGFRSRVAYSCNCCYAVCITGLGLARGHS